jgi:hypothetical protein
MKIVIQQPIFFPWYGYLELAKFADVLVHYDDVQLPRGASFTTHVQIKAPCGQLWLSAPIERSNGYMRNINEFEFSNGIDWRRKHIDTLRNYYHKAKYFNEMMMLTSNVYANDTNNLAEFDEYCDEQMISYFGFCPNILKSSMLGISGSSTERLVEICKELSAGIYITAHGALNYLNYDLFEKSNIEVMFMDYHIKPWPQFYGDFTPYVTALDLIAATGKQCVDYLDSKPIYWRDFIKKYQRAGTC